MGRLHLKICYFNALSIIFYFSVSIFYLDLPSDNLPYSIQIPVLTFLAILPNYLVDNVDSLLDFGGHDFAKEKISRKLQKQALIGAAYAFTVLMSIFSLLIIKASLNGFDYTTPILKF